MRGWKVYGIHWIFFAERRIITMKKVLITGAAGYIGRHVVKEFLDHNYMVYANDLNNKGIDDRATIIDYPIFDGNKDIFNRLGEPDALVHFEYYVAAEPPVRCGESHHSGQTEPPYY